jgi:hypothetical protein
MVRDWPELVNAATMVPGIVVSARKLRRLDERAPSLVTRLAVASFAPLCAVSIAHHLVDGRRRPGVKSATLRADYTAQQASALLHAIAMHEHRTAAALAVVAMSAATWAFDVSRQAPILALQSGVVFVASGFRVTRWWLAALAARVGSALAPRIPPMLPRKSLLRRAMPPALHGIFHVFAVAAFADLWDVLLRRQQTMMK